MGYDPNNPKYRRYGDIDRERFEIDVTVKSETADAIMCRVKTDEGAWATVWLPKSECRIGGRPIDSSDWKNEGRRVNLQVPAWLLRRYGI